MSKGQIIQHLGEARYRVRRMNAVERIAEEISSLNARITDVDQRMLDAQLELASVSAAAQQKIHEIDLLIPDLQQGIDGIRDKIATLQADLIPLQSRARQLTLKVSELRAEKLSMIKRKATLESVPDGAEMDAWCADFSEDLAGDVGLLDINDEGGQGVVIHPNHLGDAEYQRRRDGAIFPGLAQSAHQLFFNLATLPGVQKWMPHYRVGTVVSKNLDSCTVELDAAKSSAQELQINQEEILTGVPIKYMDCNGLVFEVGDRVVVRYTNSGPLVVGFESHPRQCGTRLICTPMKSTGFWEATYYGTPFESDDGAPINPPLGTEGGGNNAWIFSALQSSPYYNHQRGESQQIYGLRNWIGSKVGDVLSWHGPPSRICCLSLEFQGAGMINLYDFDTHPPYGTHVYYKRKLICDLKEVPGLPYGPTPIVDGAAIVYKNGNRYLRVCASNLTNGIYDQWSGAASFYSCMIIDFPWSGGIPDVKSPKILSEFNANYFAPATQGMYFSESGHAAVMCFGRNFYQLSVLRWSESFGFTEEGISQSGGSVPEAASGTYTYNLSDSPSSTAVTEVWQGTRYEYEMIIGFEFAGDAEQPVRLIFGQVDQIEQTSTTASYALVERYYDPEIDNYRNIWRPVSRQFLSERQMSGGEFKIALGEEIVFQVDGESYETHSGSFTETPIGPEPNTNRSGSSSTTADSYRYAFFPAVIDLRFGVVALEHEKITEVSSGQATGATQTDTQNITIESSFRVYRHGNKLIDIASEPIARTNANSADYYDKYFGPRKTFTDPYPSQSNSAQSSWYPTFMSPRNVVGFFHINSPNTSLATNARIRQASIAESNGKLMMAFEWMRRIGDNEYEPVRFTYMDDIANPVGQFMQRDPDDGYMLGKVGLI